MTCMSLCCMPVNVYALIPLQYDKFQVTLAYPCTLCMFPLCLLFCDDHRWWEQMGILLEVGLMVVAVQPSGPVEVAFEEVPWP